MSIISKITQALCRYRVTKENFFYVVAAGVIAVLVASALVQLLVSAILGGELK